MDTQGITGWALSTLVPIALLVIGLLILFTARKGRWSDVMSTVGIAIVGIVVIVGAGGLVLFGKDLAGIVFKG